MAATQLTGCTMKQTQFAARRLAIFLSSLALLGAAGCSIHANESGDGKSIHISVFGHANHVSHGHNRTKGSGVQREESRQVANFSTLQLLLPAEVTVTQGSTEWFSISADDNLLALVNARVENGTLIIDCDKNKGFSTRNAIKIRLGVKTLEGVTIKGSGDVLADDLQAQKFDVAIFGSGDVKVKTLRAAITKIEINGSGDVAIDRMEAKSIDVAIHGSGDIKLPSVEAASVAIAVNGSGDVAIAGSADMIDVDLAGSGDMRARHLVAREANVRIAASGDAEVHAQEKLTARVAGSGEIRYAGAPTNIDRKVRGSGSIEAM